MPTKKKTTPRKGKKSVHWKKDPEILERLLAVEPLYVSGVSNREIGRQIGIDERTVREDIKRLLEVWLDRIGEAQNVHRAAAVAKLNQIAMRGLAAAEFDESCERAVLFGDEVEVDGKTRSVVRDDKGSAQFRGNKAAGLQVARQAIMDQAKLMGIDVNKLALTDGDGLSLAELCQAAKEEGRA